MLQEIHVEHRGFPFDLAPACVNSPDISLANRPAMFDKFAVI